jgi:hypothetical protein
MQPEYKKQETADCFFTGEDYSVFRVFHGRRKQLLFPENDAEMQIWYISRVLSTFLLEYSAHFISFCGNFFHKGKF